MSDAYTPTSRTRVIREPQRAIYDRAAAYAILDEAFICHIGFTLDGQPYVIPTSFGRNGDGFTISGKNGRVQFGGVARDIPSWVPSYPGSKPQFAVQAQGFSGDGGEFNFETPDHPSDVLDFYERTCRGQGMSVHQVSGHSNGGTLVIRDESQRHTLNVVASRRMGGAEVMVTYSTR